MKNILYIFSILLLVSCSSTDTTHILVKNDSPLDFQSDIVEVDISNDLSHLQLEANHSYVVRNELKEIIPSQVTYDGKLIFQASIKANKEAVYEISIDTISIYTPLVFGRHYPERKGDFSWENNKVGFRVYGKELKTIQAPTSAIDLWYKRTDKLVLDEWYRKELSKEASYHVDHGEGCDPYPVGQTLGAGGMGILKDSILYLNENFDQFEILDNGPLRITVKLVYPSQEIDGSTIQDIRIFSLDANSQLIKVTQEFITPDLQIVAAGFPKREKGDSILYTQGQDYFIYEEPLSEENGQIYLGLLLPEGINHVLVSSKTRVGNSKDILTNAPNVVATTNYHPNKPLIYYTGFGWNKYGFENVDIFKEYMQEYAEKLQKPLIVKKVK